MAIHRAAAEGYEHVADTYDRGRGGYPAAALDSLTGELGIGPGSTVVELGAGTGKCTADLVRTGARVIAVEPVGDMRRKLADNVSGVDIRDGTAEAIPVDDAAADAVVVAQAFHWFDGPRALTEIARVLRPEGGLGLIWNVIDRSSPWVDQIWTIVDRHEGDAPRYYRAEWKHAFARDDALTELEHHQFSNPVPIDVDGVVDRVLSISFIARLDDDERKAVAAAVESIARLAPQPLSLPYRTDVFWCRRR